MNKDDTVMLINEGENVFNDKYDGVPYNIPPGHAVKTIRAIAYHFTGNPHITDELEKEAEKKRVRLRYGAFSPDLNHKIPKLKVEEIEQVVPVAFVPEKKAAISVTGEEEFPGLKIPATSPEESEEQSAPKRPKPLKRA